MNYFKWLFTRWYLYAIAVLIAYVNKIDEKMFIVEFYGVLAADFFVSGILISIVVGIKSLFKKKA